MAAKKKSSFSNAILNFVFLIPNILNLARNMIYIARREAKLAGRSFIRVTVLAFILAALLASTWFCALALIVAYLISIHWTWLQAFGAITILNLLLIIIVTIAILKAKNALIYHASFQELKDLDCPED